MSEMLGVYKEHKWWKLNLFWKILSVWIICRVLMALVRIFITNMWGQCEWGIILLKSMGLHWGNIFEGWRMETNRSTYPFGKSRIRPMVSFCFPLLYSAFIENLLSWAVGPLDSHLGAHVWLWWQHHFQLKQTQLPVDPANPTEHRTQWTKVWQRNAK